MKSNTHPHLIRTTAGLALCLTLLATQGCSWDAAAYKTYVHDDNITICNGYCDGVEIIPSKEACEALTGDWTEEITPYCILAKAFAETKEECEKNEGLWKTGACSISKENCSASDPYPLTWKDLKYEILDLRDGNYIRAQKNADSGEYTFTCGSFEQILNQNAPECSADYNSTISEMKQSLKANICMAQASHCVEFKIDNEVFNKLKGIGVCSSCSQNNIICNGNCTNIINDKQNCGGCGKVCNEDQFCENGTCQSKNCTADTIPCYCDNNTKECFDTARDNSTLQCIDSTSASTCGAKSCSDLGHQCPIGQFCTETFDCECLNDLIKVDDKCLSPFSPETCGISHTKPGEQCITDISYCDGTECQCLPGFLKCESKCIDVLSDIKNCGKCGNDCGDNASCNNGECICDQDYAKCDNGKCIRPHETDFCGAKGNCTDFQPDSPNYKGDKCRQNFSCLANDSKEWKCTCVGDGYRTCDDQCIVSTNDVHHCGPQEMACEELVDCTIALNSENVRCDGGQCKCAIGYNAYPKDQPTSCIDNSINPMSCGPAAIDCTQNTNGEVLCNNGNCVEKCSGSKIRCGNTCLDPATYHVQNIEGTNDCECVDTTASYCPDYLGQPNLGCKTAHIGDANNCSTCQTPDNQDDPNVICQDSFVCSAGQCRCLSTDDATAPAVCEYETNEFNHNKSMVRRCVDLGKADLHLTDCKTCEEHWGNLDGDWANGCESDLSSDPNHCGAIDVVCKDVLTNTTGIDCIDNQCVYTTCSNKQFLDCSDNTGDPLFSDGIHKIGDGCETNVSNDPKRCGSCQNICISGFCENSECCYKENSNIFVPQELFSCCEGQYLYRYDTTIPFCFGDNRFGCFTEDKRPTLCWRKVTD